MSTNLLRSAWKKGCLRRGLPGCARKDLCKSVRRRSNKSEADRTHPVARSDRTAGIVCCSAAAPETSLEAELEPARQGLGACAAGLQPQAYTTANAQHTLWSSGPPAGKRIARRTSTIYQDCPGNCRSLPEASESRPCLSQHLCISCSKPPEAPHRLRPGLVLEESHTRIILLIVCA